MSVHIQLRDFNFQDVSHNDFQVGAASESVQNFLDSAILAAWRDVSDVSPVSLPPALTPARWLWRLAGSYHTTHDTSAFLRQAAERFVAAERWELAKWASERANEEQGHDQLALLDIQAMGYDPHLVVNHLAPPAAMELVNYFSQQVKAVDPIGCVGYSYVLERLATRINESTIQNIEAMLPPGTKATRCLRVHSSLGADADHVKENIEMISQLTLAEQFNIAIACYETAKLCFTPPKGGYISETKLLQQLQALSGFTNTPNSCLSSHALAIQNQPTTHQQNMSFQGVFTNSSQQLTILLDQLQVGLPNELDESF